MHCGVFLIHAVCRQAPVSMYVCIAILYLYVQSVVDNGQKHIYKFPVDRISVIIFTWFVRLVTGGATTHLLPI